jgi:hypothetical protein
MDDMKLHRLIEDINNNQLLFLGRKRILTGIFERVADFGGWMGARKAR